MKIPAIKKLVDNYTLDQISKAEDDIVEGRTPEIEIEGEDEGEMLTHVFAARFILFEMSTGKDYKSAVREFSSKVRNSLS